MAAKKYKVIQWGAGGVGSYALRYILKNPVLELVGIKCNTKDKEGKTAGEICGLDIHSNIRATRDNKALLDMDADCVVFSVRDSLTDPTAPGAVDEPWLTEMLAILESGKNLVTTLTAGTHFRHLHDGSSLRKRLDAACAKGNSTVLFSGFDPGYSDILAITMSGAVGEIKKISTWEILDWGQWTAVDVLRNLGFGLTPEKAPAGMLNTVRTTWGGMPYLMGDALGVNVDDIKLDADICLAPETYTAKGGLLVEKGTIGAIRFSVSGMVDEKPMFVVNHVTRIGSAIAPDWPQIGHDGGYRVEVDSFPPFKAEIPMGLPGGTGSSMNDAVAYSAARCVNVIESLVNAKAGYITYLDLPPPSGRHAVVTGK